MVVGYVVVCCGFLEYMGRVARPIVHHLISSGARRTLTLCVRMLARRVSFCVEARTLASRERYGYLVLLSSVSVGSFQQGATDARVEARWLPLLRPQLRTPKGCFGNLLQKM